MYQLIELTAVFILTASLLFIIVSIVYEIYTNYKEQKRMRGHRNDKHDYFKD